VQGMTSRKTEARCPHCEATINALNCGNVAEQYAKIMLLLSSMIFLPWSTNPKSASDHCCAPMKLL
jgi:hypothetical protein